ncbi:hypothetical protein GCM10022221_67970 [Actinocorallia aurea]
MQNAAAITGTVYQPADPAKVAEARFPGPVLISSTVHKRYIAWTDADSDRTGVYQEPGGRMWDVLCSARGVLELAQADPDHIAYFSLLTYERGDHRDRDARTCQVEHELYLEIDTDADGGPSFRIVTLFEDLDD